MHRCRSGSAPRRGVATLVVVMVLFFIMAMVAGYTNRNLIFEQRTSVNQYRSTQALEAAEAGVEWALSMLNAGRIDADCQPTSDLSASSFRQRYLSFNLNNGVITPLTPGGAAPTPTCVFDGTDWDCGCPSSGSVTPSAPSGAGIFPAFRLRFMPEASRAGLVWLEVNGCTRLDEACLAFPAQAVSGEGRALVRMLVALKSALPAPPIAAVTTRLDLNLQTAPFAAYAPTVGANNLAVLAGGAIQATNSVETQLTRGGPPGTPAELLLLVRQNDPALQAPDVANRDRMFAVTFAADKAPYRDQSAAIRLNCEDGTVTCDATTLRAIAARNPGRVMWAEGDVELDSGADLGSPNEPVLLVIEDGDAEIGITVHGVVFALSDAATLSGAGTVRGAMLAASRLVLDPGSSITVVHDPAVLAGLRWSSGSFLRVPGGWRDF